MSIAGQIGDAMAAGIQGAGLVLADQTALANASILRRKTPALPPGKDPPQVVVVVGEEGESERLTATQKLKKWAAAVVIITADGTKLADDEVIRTWREQIDAAIYDKQRKTFAALSGFNYVRSTGKSPFDPAALAKDFNYSTLNYTFEVIEDLAK